MVYLYTYIYILFVASAFDHHGDSLPEPACAGTSVEDPDGAQARGDCQPEAASAGDAPERSQARVVLVEARGISGPQITKRSI